MMYECIKHSSEIYRVTEMIMKMMKVRLRVREKKRKWEVFTLAKRKEKIAKWPRQKLEIEIGDDLINFRFLICCWGDTEAVHLHLNDIKWDLSKNIKKEKKMNYE